MSNEQWRDIPGLEGAYQASSLGNIRSLPRTVSIGRATREISGKVLSLFAKPAGYLACRAGGQQMVHRLVALAWCEGHFDGAFVDHLNGDRTDNRPENLEWVTPSENVRRPFALGRREGNWKGRFSSEHPTSKAVIAVNMRTGERTLFASAMDAVREGFESAAISRCCNGTATYHKGHNWHFAEDMNGIHLTETIRGGFHDGANDRRVA
jgi:hypothetical protein